MFKATATESLMSRILFLGDVHGSWAHADYLLDQLEASPYEWDEIIQVGDLGFWPGLNPPWRRTFDHPARWVDGNHEQFDRLEKREAHFGVPPETSWVAGWETFLQTWEYQPRGTITDGILFVGGGRSVNKPWLTPGHNWFPQENLSEADKEHVLAQVEAYGPENIHTVVAHDCPTRFDVMSTVIAAGRQFTAVKLGPDPNRPFLDDLFEIVRPDRWLFGHYHVKWSAVVDGCEARCVSLVNDADFQIIDIPEVPTPEVP